MQSQFTNADAVGSTHMAYVFHMYQCVCVLDSSGVRGGAAAGGAGEEK